MNESIVNIGLINPKSPKNVDSVRRSAGNYRVASIFYTGVRYLRALQMNPNTPNISRKVSENISVSEVDTIFDEIPKNAQIVCVELAENAIPLPEYQHPDNAFYIFGPEDGSIDQATLDRADAVTYIPTVGCMNLAATVNVVLYDRLSKSTQKFEHNELIRNSRDRNNKLKVRL